MWSKLVNILFLLVFACGAAQAANLEPCEHWFGAKGKRPKGVMIVSHGLNLRPDKMDDLARFFSANGYDVYRAAFYGHCGESSAQFHNTRPEFWLKDARRIYAYASAEAKKKKIPLYLLAYSFSALVFESASREMPFEKKIYLAPAFATHFWYPLLRFIAGFFPHYVFSSLNLPDYRANDTSNFTSMLALDEMLKDWKKSGHVDLAPTLIWIDPKDELVSFSGLQAYSADKPGYHLEKLSADGTDHKKIHHLIVDEASLGEDEWKRVAKKSLLFLQQADQKK